MGLKRTIIFVIIFSISTFCFADNDDLLLADLHTKEYATYNDGIKVIRVLHKDTDHNAMYLDNILWAAKQKLFKVAIPIQPDKLNPYLTRMELAYWICGIYNLNHAITLGRPFRYHSYNICVHLGLMEPGSGPLEKLTCQQLLDCIYHLENYVRLNNIKLNKNIENQIDDVYDESDYESYPHWRRTLYKELDEQQESEREKRKELIEKRKEEREKNKKEEWERR